MEEEVGENLVGNLIGEEINCSGFLFFLCGFVYFSGFMGLIS